MVEIAGGGRDYSNPDMFSPKYPGEGKEYADPREAVKAALTIRDLWKKDAPDEEIGVDEGCTGGWTMPFDGSDDDTLIAWAEKEYADLEKCARCGNILGGRQDHWIEIYEPPYGGYDGTLMNETMDPKEYYCSENCGDLAYDDAYKYWAESERDNWLAQIDDPRYASVWLRDTRTGYRNNYENYDIDDEDGEVLYRENPESNDQLVIDVAELHKEYGDIGFHTGKVIDHAREVFTLEAPVVEIGK
jgi:hypothetical protein